MSMSESYVRVATTLMLTTTHAAFLSSLGSREDNSVGRSEGSEAASQPVHCGDCDR